MKVGDIVTVDKQTDERGFRKKIVGVVDWIDKNDPVFLMRPQSIYAYHPDLPEGGRDLPCPWTLIAFDVSEIVPNG